MKKILLVAALATFSLNAFAQGGARGPFLTNRAFDNWFFSAGGGVNVYYGESDKIAKFSTRMAPALDLSLGKWFTPAVGARLQYSGLKAKGISNTASAPFVSGNRNSAGYYPERFNVTFLHADFLWNLSSALGGYKAHRRLEFIPFAGFGGAFASANGRKDRELALAAGLINKFRVSNALDLNLELRGMLVNQRFDGTSGGRRGEGMATATLGLTYKFRHRGFEVPEVVAAADYTPYNDRIRSLESDLSAARARIDQYARDLNAARNATPPAAPAARTEFIIPQMAVFFRIGRATLTEQEKINIGYIAEVLKKMPADRKFRLVGNADSATGSARRNQLLSEQRAKAVYDALVAAGVNPSQLQIIAHGDTQEPFPHNQPTLNRVLIIE